jgi:hypothetical protein
MVLKIHIINYFISSYVFYIIIVIMLHCAYIFYLLLCAFRSLVLTSSGGS